MKILENGKFRELNKTDRIYHVLERVKQKLAEKQIYNKSKEG